MHGNTRRSGKIAASGVSKTAFRKTRHEIYAWHDRIDNKRNFYKKAGPKKAATGIKLLQMLETNLDNLGFRNRLTSTRAQARQLIKQQNIFYSTTTKLIFQSP